MAIGPTESQREALIRTNLNPADYAHMNSHQITQVLQGIFARSKDYRGPAGTRKKATAERARQVIIAGLGLKPGTKILRRVPTRGKEGKPQDDVVTGITKNYHVSVHGLKNPIHPSQVIEVVKQPIAP